MTPVTAVVVVVVSRANDRGPIFGYRYGSDFFILSVIAKQSRGWN